MSIQRISTNTIPDNGMYSLRGRQFDMDRVNNQINTGNKNRLPRENPVDVTQAMTFHTAINRTDQYIRNIQDANNERGVAEVKLMNTVDIIQRVRELAVQGANGVYTDDERQMMAVEVDQLLRNVILNANSRYKDDYLFSGFNKYTQPFEVMEGAVRGINQSMITEVKYLGDNGAHRREIDSGELVAVARPGSEAFWAEQHQIYSSVNTADFRLTQDSVILIDKNRIEFNEGDNVYAIMDKINKSDVAVNASIDPVTGGLILKTTRPHRMELSDIEGGRLLQDLGILENGFAIGPENVNQGAMEFGGSVFDVLIGLRDAMIQNNQEDIGSRFLGALDMAMGNLTQQLAETGALDNRMNYLTERHNSDKERFTIGLSKANDIDVAESITELKMLEFAHKAALSSLARLSQPTLMDFMR